MKLIINNNILLSRLIKLSKILPKAAVKPIDSYMLWTVTGNNLNIRVHGNEIQLSCDLPVVSDGDFAIAVPTMIVLQTLTLFTLPETEFSYEVKNNVEVLSIKSGKKSAYKLTGEAASLYPNMATENESNSVKLGSSFLKKALSSSFSFIDTSDGFAMRMPSTQGISMKVSGQSVIIDATGPFACSRQIMLHDEITSWSDIIIPRQMGEIINEVMSDDEDITISHDRMRLEIPGKLFNIRCKLLEHKFPDMGRIISQRDNCITSTIDRVDFHNALKRIKLYNDKEKLMVIDITSNKLTMCAESQLLGGEGREDIDIASEREIKIGLNIDQMLMAMTKLTADKMVFSYDNKARPAFIEPDYNGDTSPTYKSIFLLNPFKI